MSIEGGQSPAFRFIQQKQLAPEGLVPCDLVDRADRHLQMQFDRITGLSESSQDCV